MNVLSLFDGMSCCFLALQKVGITPTKYYAAEIDKFAIKAATTINPGTIHIGSVTDWRNWNIDFATIDLVTGGFPCQAWSMAGKQLGDKDERGMLFWVMLDIMKECKKHNPKVKFLIENVKMKKEFEEYITFHTEQALGKVHKILINSALVSAQNRNRYYWCNWHVEQPEDKGILLKDIIDNFVSDQYLLSEKIINGFQNKKGAFSGRFKPMDVNKKEKSFCLTARYYKCGATDPYIKCGAMRGRNIVDGKRKDFKGAPTRQQIEIRKDEKTNALTTVQKDNLLIKVGMAGDIKGHDCNRRIFSIEGKSPTLTAMGGGHREPKILQTPRGKNKGGIKSDNGKTPTLTSNSWEQNNKLVQGVHYRKLTPRECGRLQTVPEDIIDRLIDSGLSNTQLYKMFGNGWTVDVISHIFSSIELPIQVFVRQLDLFDNLEH